MQSQNQYNKKKGTRKASFDSEDEGHFIADEQAHTPIYNQLDHDDFYGGTQELDQGGRNGIQGFVTPTTFIDKESLAYRKNRFVLNNNVKLKGKNQTTQNSMNRKEKIGMNSSSPINSKNNYSSKNVAFVSAQKPAIQNLPPSIVLNSKQYKLNNQIKGSQTATNSFVKSPSGHQKNKHSFGENQKMSMTSKNSPLRQTNLKQHSNLNVRQSFKSSQTAGSGNNGNTPSQQYGGSQYNTLNQNIKAQMNMIKKQKQMEVLNAQNQIRSQKNMTIKTKCVSLEVSQERDSENSPSSYFATNLSKKVKTTPYQDQSVPGQNLKIKRSKPMISQTMKNSKQGSLNSTPTRHMQYKKNAEELKQGTMINTYLKNKSSQDNSRIEATSNPGGINQNSQQESKILPDSIHNIQFTRNTQANAKTVTNVAQVLHPVQHGNFDTSKKNLSQTKSVALSIDNSDANQGRIGSVCTSMTHLNKNINLRMGDTKKSSQAGITGEEAQSKNSSNRGDHALGMIQVNSPFKPSNKGSLNKLKKIKGNTISQGEAIGLSKQSVGNSIPGNMGQFGAISQTPQGARAGVSFTKNKLGIKNQEHLISTAKNMNINESMGKKTIGLSSKLKLGNKTGKAVAQPSHVSNSTTGLNTKIISNYVSKTAQVSAYASKNNSNNSSVVRGGEALNPVIQHKTLGSRLNAVLKKKKQSAGISIDQDNSSLAHTSKQSTSNFNIGNSSLSLKDKQINMTTGKKNIGIKTQSIGDSSSNQLRHVTNIHHIQSNKSNLYSTSTGTKHIKNSSTLIKKAGVGIQKSSGVQVLSQSQNFLSMSNTTLKQKTDLKLSNIKFKQDVKPKEGYKGHIFSSLSNNSKVMKISGNSNIKISKKGLNTGSKSPFERVSDARPQAVRQSDDEFSPRSSQNGDTMFNSTQNKGSSVPKKQLQPSQAKNSMRSVEKSYRRAGYQSIQISNSPSREDKSANNYSTRQPLPANNPLFSFNDIKEEMKETESQHEGNRGNQQTINMDDIKSPNKRKREDTENSMILQIQEYKRDILNLKKSITLYFKQYGEMQGSSCHFYRIGRVLGRGAFGKVNLACHKVTEHLVAIKALEKKVLDNEKTTKKRVMQEIAILKQSNHHNVVRLYDSFETQKHICFVMELCQGGDLLSYVRKRRKLKEDNAKYLFKQLIEGLNYIHTQKFVIHRDIKLDNILLDASGRIKICDFGVSKQVKSEKERMYEQCGTPAYIAPEVSNKQKGYKGFKADMWSAGVCLYVMLIGTVPFRAGSMKELHEMIRKGKYSLQGEILSNEAKNLLASLLNVNYHKRLSAKETLKHPWFKMAQDNAQEMVYDREDLSQVIFTQKEIETIQKDYITRLEKLKKQRLKKDIQLSPGIDAHKNHTGINNTTTFDDDFLFTEHNLDTKEDQKQDLLENKQQINSMFTKNDKQDQFQKFEGLIVKKPVQNEYQQDEEKNLSEKSIIFCPFNSSFSDFDEEHPELFDWPESVQEILQPKKSKIIKFSKKCRDLNREYECNNNADLDNGVYNAFVNEQEMEAEKNQKMYPNNKTEEDQMPTQSLHQSSSSSSLGGSPIVSYQNSECEDIYKAGKAPQNSFVQNEISIHESMQKMHEGQWVNQAGPQIQTPQTVAINNKLIDITVELFKYSQDRNDSVYGTIREKLKIGLQTQDLNYLTSAYYLTQKYDKIDE